MIWCRDLQYFDSIAVRVSAIGKGAAARHVQRGCMKYHSHLEQPFIFSLAIGDLKAQMAEAGFAATLRGCSDIGMQGMENSEELNACRLESQA